MYILIQRELSTLIEAVLPTLPMLYLPFNVYLDSKRIKHTHRSSFANITNVVPSLQCISWFEESKHTHRSSFCQHYQCCTFPSMYILILFESRYTLKGRYDIGNVGKTASMSMITLFESRYTCTLNKPTCKSFGSMWSLSHESEKLGVKRY